MAAEALAKVFQKVEANLKDPVSFLICSNFYI